MYCARRAYPFSQGQFHQLPYQPTSNQPEHRPERGGEVSKKATAVCKGGHLTAGPGATLILSNKACRGAPPRLEGAVNSVLSPALRHAPKLRSCGAGLDRPIDLELPFPEAILNLHDGELNAPMGHGLRDGGAYTSFASSSASSFRITLRWAASSAAASRLLKRARLSRRMNFSMGPPRSLCPVSDLTAQITTPPLGVRNSMCRWVFAARLPFPSSQSKNVLIQFVGNTLRPRSQLSCTESNPGWRPSKRRDEWSAFLEAAAKLCWRDDEDDAE